MDTKAQTAGEDLERGFSTRHGVDWTKYMLYRPTYPESFFRRIYNYHGQKPGASWSTAHDVGAGPGIVSSTLVDTFNHVIVSDPDEGHGKVARQVLVEEAGIPESRLVFLREDAESSSVEAGTVDLITACECIQYTDTANAVSEFARQLGPGGTLAVTLYSRPYILGNERAQSVWNAMFTAVSRKYSQPLFQRAFRILNSGLDCVALPPEDWEAVKRVYVNAGRGTETFRISDDVPESRVGSNEELVWIYGDPDWSDKEREVDSLRGLMSTWAPGLTESEARGYWEELESALDGATFRTETPVVIVLATKRA
ncbi:putative methyltransferase type 11 [Rosellinia necatrix]|uniref:Putative methyltransferase type 11 n=1 Tax=Rosellinia necatrix TaxID=77044 RepID=A0A1W2TJI1_ROSNE|nr:putative methyltransferase type 11 [Rosellinia necatrix]